MLYRLSSSAKKVVHQLDELSRIATDVALMESESAGWCIRQHVEHLVLAGEYMVAQMEKSLRLPPERHRTSGRLKVIARVVLLAGIIPRGKAQAPKLTIPTNVDSAELQGRLQELHRRARQLGEQLPAIRRCRHRSMHPVLGAFTPSQWMRFICIHQEHHLKIIRDLGRNVTQ